MVALKRGGYIAAAKDNYQDFDALGRYLKTQVGWVSVEKIKSTIDPKHADVRKLEAAKYIGFLERDGSNVRLTDLGRKYATSDDETVRQEAMLAMLQSVELYADTVHWMHFSKKIEPTKTDVGNYWHDLQSDKIEGAKGSGLTDGVIFFLRLAGAAGLGHFVNAGTGRPQSFLRGDAAAIERAATTPIASGGQGTPADQTPTAAASGTQSNNPPSSPATPPPPPSVNVQTSPAVHVNIEIHIAADATAATVEEIFKNMRKYVLNNTVAEDGK
jgi:hypothetical protein